MTWDQLTAVGNAGNEIGGHTLDEYNLQGCTDQQTCTNEVCQDRQNLISHGFSPTSFAYPFGAYDANAQSIVQGCGYTAARRAGGIDNSGPGAGPVYAEAIPPKDALAIRSPFNYSAPATLTLDHLESAVTAAAQNGGGWEPMIFHQICSQTYDPDHYSTCTSSFSPVELDTLTAFITWMQNAGQPGGAPAGTVLKTMRQVLNGS
jgi:hypothetical protein